MTTEDVLNSIIEQTNPTLKSYIKEKASQVLLIMQQYKVTDEEANYPHFINPPDRNYSLHELIISIRCINPQFIETRIQQLKGITK